MSYAKLDNLQLLKIQSELIRPKGREESRLANEENFSNAF